MKEGERVRLKSWMIPGQWVGGIVESVLLDGRARVVVRDDGSAQWRLTTKPRDAGCGATSYTILAEGDASSVELARGALGGAADMLEARERNDGRMGPLMVTNLGCAIDVHRGELGPGDGIVVMHRRLADLSAEERADMRRDLADALTELADRVYEGEP